MENKIPEPNTKNFAGAHLADELLASVEELNAPTELELSKPSLDESLEQLLAPYDNAVSLEVSTMNASEAILRSFREDPGATNKKLASLCTQRNSGSDYRFNNPAVGKLDMVLVELLRQNELNAAIAIVSSSPKEKQNLEFAIGRTDFNEEDKNEILKRGLKLRNQKQSELFTHLTENGLDARIADKIIAKSEAPDSAYDVPKDFWPSLSTMPADATRAFWEGQADIRKTAEIIQAIISNELGEHAEAFVQGCSNFKNPEERHSYLASSKIAVNALGILEPENSYSQIRREAIKVAAGFANPASGVADTQVVFGELTPTSIRTFSALSERYPTNLVHYNEKLPEALKAIYQDPATNIYITEIALRLQGTNDPISSAIKIQSGVNAVIEIFGKSELYERSVISSANPSEMARILIQNKDLISKSSPELVRTFVDMLGQSTIPAEIGDSFLKTMTKFSAMGVELGTIDILSYKGLGQILKAQESGEKLDITAERFCTNFKIGQEYSSAYERYMAPIAESGLSKAADHTLKPKLEDIPTLMKEFNNAGLDQVSANKLLDTWNGFMAFSTLRYKMGDQDTDRVTPQFLESAASLQREKIMKQVGAFGSYLDEFGSDEIQTVMSTFGITNFARYKPSQLHEQLEKWNKSETQYENIIFSAQSDWNGAIENAGSEFSKDISDNAVYFELTKANDIAKLLVEFGNRERTNGHNPMVDSKIKNVIIHGHANSEVIVFGVDGAGLNIKDYIDIPSRRSKINAKSNNYGRHIGTKYRLILQACSTASTPIGERNIAETLSQEHEIEVAGSPFATTGAFKIEPDGSVNFRVDSKEGSNVGAVVYDSRGN